MRMVFCAAAIAFACLSSYGAFAEEAQEQKQVVFLRVTDSLKDTEIHLAKILLERLKVNSSLQMRNNNPDDLMVQARFNANEEQGLPAIAMVIDTRITGRDSENKPTAQVISVASFADIKLAADKRAELLEWANNWNARTIPMRVYLSGDKVVAARNLFNATDAPLSENAVITAFGGIVRAWKTLIADLEKNGLIES